MPKDVWRCTCATQLNGGKCLFCKCKESPSASQKETCPCTCATQVNGGRCIYCKYRGSPPESPETVLQSRKPARLLQRPRNHETNNIIVQEGINKGNQREDQKGKNSMIFSREEISASTLLGHGSFGAMLRGTARGKDVAIKTLLGVQSSQERAQFAKESSIMCTLQHPHILKIFGVCFHRDKLYIILELMEGGNLRSFLKGCSHQLPGSSMVKICVHVARGCAYLAQKQLVHRDLAARNCLVSNRNLSTMVIKISDFGLTRQMYSENCYQRAGGPRPVRRMSPEFLRDGIYTTASDVWSFGVLVWEVMTMGQTPYPNIPDSHVASYVLSKGRLLQSVDHSSNVGRKKTFSWSKSP